MAKKSRLKAILVAGAALAIVMTATPALAQQRAFNLPAQSATRSIPEFGRQAGIQIIAPGGILRSMRTPALRGTYDVRAALRTLLADSGLRIVSDEGGTITLGAATANPPQGEDPAGGDAADSESAQREILVTGSRIRGANVAAPLISVTREDIERSGATSTAEVFATLPQNFASLEPDGSVTIGGADSVVYSNGVGATAVDLRGLGAASTLTLVNGVRRAPSVYGQVTDVSAIPLSFIDRVEIVSGGRSAIYGADAVAGVVNIVTRRDFEGAESQASYTALTDQSGGDSYRLSQVTGMSRERFGFVLGYDYEHRDHFDLSRNNLVLVVPGVEESIRRDGAPNSNRHALSASGRYSLSHSVELTADVFYHHRDIRTSGEFRYTGANTNSTGTSRNNEDGVSASANLGVELPAAWRLNVGGNLSFLSDKQAGTGVSYFPGNFSVDTSRTQEISSSQIAGSVVAEGPLPEIGWFVPRVAIGAEYRVEGFRYVNQNILESDATRKIVSLFGEINLPLAGDNDPRRTRLDVTIAGRYDHYSDFGSTFNPQIGVAFSSPSGIAISGGYSTSFRAPQFYELRASNTSLGVGDFPDPTSATGTTPVLFLIGANPDLGTERARIWTGQFEYRPTFAPWAKLSVTYFDIAYRGRIGTPTFDLIIGLQREDIFASLIDRSPSAEQLAALLVLDSDRIIENYTARTWNGTNGFARLPITQPIQDVFPNIAVFDDRTANIGLESVRGLDVGLSADVNTSIGQFSFDFNGTYTPSHSRSITTTSPAQNYLNEVGKPVDFRARSTVGWSRGKFSAFLSGNYTDGYSNQFSSPASHVDAWTTFDLTLRYGGASNDRDRRWVASVSISNLFNAAPPLLTGIQDARYDAANASPFRRTVSLRLGRRW